MTFIHIRPQYCFDSKREMQWIFDYYIVYYVACTMNYILFALKTVAAVLQCTLIHVLAHHVAVVLEEVIDVTVII